MFYRKVLYAEDAGSRFLLNVGTSHPKITCSVCYVVHKSFVLCDTQYSYSKVIISMVCSEASVFFF